MVAPERTFWRDILPPVAIYLTRQRTLKPDEIDQARQHRLEGYYAEIVAAERAAGVVIHEIANNGSFEDLWHQIVALL